MDVIEDLFEGELEQIIDDFESYMAIEQQKGDAATYTLFWQSCVYVAVAELKKLREKNREASVEGGGKVHTTVLAEIRYIYVVYVCICMYMYVYIYTHMCMM